MAQGKLFVRLAHVNGRTRLIEHHQSAPLKIARAFEREDGGLDICIMDASPGLLAGDHYELIWVLETGAKARITTQGATRIHPSDGPLSIQKISIEMQKESSLEWWPESTIPFPQARFHSQIDVYLREKARLTLFESLSAGRVARNEIFDFAEATLQLKVEDDQGIRFFTRNTFKPKTDVPRSLLSWGNHLQWSSLYAFGNDCATPKQAQQLIEQNGIWGGASFLARGDLVVSMLGRRAHDLRSLALDIERCWK